MKTLKANLEAQTPIPTHSIARTNGREAFELFVTHHVRFSLMNLYGLEFRGE